MKPKYAAVIAAAVVSTTLTAGPAAAESAMGRQLVGQFCSNPNAMPAPGACIALSFDGQTAQGYTDSPSRVLAIRPGVYWLTVTDLSAVHNFSLATPDGVAQDITGVAATPGQVTLKINFTPGTWMLFCEPHRDMGMYVDIEVSGVGQQG